MPATGLCYFQLHILDSQQFGNILHKYERKKMAFLK